MRYLKPEMEIVELKVEDIIVTSFVGEENGTPGNEGDITTPDNDWGN